MRHAPVRRMACAAALLLTAAGAARAQDSATPTAEGMALAGQVVQAIGIQGVADAAMQGLKMVIVSSLAQHNGQTEDKVLPVVDAIVMPDLRARQPRFVAAVSAEYAQRFTVAELQEILAFYQTPTGEKLQALTPQLTQQMVALGRAWVSQAGQEVLGQDEAKLKAQGLSVR